MKKLLVLLILVSTTFLVACGVATPENPEPTGETAVPTTAVDAYPGQSLATPVTDTAYPGQVDVGKLTPEAGDGTPVVAPQPGVPDTGEALTQTVREDLAQRLNLDISAIEVVSREAVDWADSAMGCPAPDMNYLQVITPGYEITLQAEGQTYDYHTDTRGFFVLCGPTGQPVP
jgi:hypothetical protein